MTIGRRVATAFIRHRVREEAKRLQARYDAKGISRNANRDIFVVTDFDGTVASQLGPTGRSKRFLCLRVRDELVNCSRNGTTFPARINSRA